MFVFVFHFDDAFFVGDFADASQVCILLQGVHGFVDFGFVHNYADAPAHVEGSKHFLVGNCEAKFGCGSLDYGEDGVRVKLLNLKPIPGEAFTRLLNLV